MSVWNDKVQCQAIMKKMKLDEWSNTMVEAEQQCNGRAMPNDVLCNVHRTMVIKTAAAGGQHSHGTSVLVPQEVMLDAKSQYPMIFLRTAESTPKSDAITHMDAQKNMVNLNVTKDVQMAVATKIGS